MLPSRQFCYGSAILCVNKRRDFSKWRYATLSTTLLWVCPLLRNTYCYRMHWVHCQTCTRRLSHNQPTGIISPRVSTCHSWHPQLAVFLWICQPLASFALDLPTLQVLNRLNKPALSCSDPFLSVWPVLLWLCQPCNFPQIELARVVLEKNARGK